MTTSSDTGTVLITGPTSGLGKALALELANREAPERPDLLLVGRPGDRLAEITGAVRAAGAAAEPIPCDLARARRRPGRRLRMMGVPGPQWRDPVDLARPAVGEKPTSAKAAQVAYANAKLAILYYAHELQRHVGDQVHVLVFEPGFMPGTGLIREAGPVMQALLRAMGHLPGGTTPARSAPAFAAVVLEDRWARVRDGAFIVIDKEAEVLPHARDRERETRLWEATSELLNKASADGPGAGSTAIRRDG